MRSFVADWWSRQCPPLEIEERAGTLLQRRGAKTEMILRAIANIPGDFTVQDLQERAPTASKKLIRHVLGQERDAGHLVSSGRGRDAHWRRTGSSG